MDDRQEDRTKFVVGLGNPGRKYEQTRHNLGYRVLDVLRGRWGLDPAGRAGFHGRVWLARAATGGRVILLAPETYMNRSGLAVAEMMRFHRGQCEDLLVVHDDLALPDGQLRARTSGSAGGHNGLADVLRAMGTDEIPRLRIGIGPPPGPMDAADYVLAKISPDAFEGIGVAVEQAADAVELWVSGGIRPVMDQYNRKAQQQDP